jgi:hypothetical protein
MEVVVVNSALYLLAVVDFFIVAVYSSFNSFVPSQH